MSTYNGWKNYETWAVNLWLSNDEASYQMVEDIIDEAKSPYDAAQALEIRIEDDSPLAGSASLYTDLLSAALSEVDWLGIIESFTS